MKSIILLFLILVTCSLTGEDKSLGTKAITDRSNVRKALRNHFAVGKAELIALLKQWWFSELPEGTSTTLKALESYSTEDEKSLDDFQLHWWLPLTDLSEDASLIPRPDMLWAEILVAGVIIEALVILLTCYSLLYYKHLADIVKAEN
jgi:hypothetical protein